MKNLKNIVLFTIISLLLFCGCSQENKSASDTVNPQDGKSVSEQQETIVDSEKAAENVTDKMSLLEAVGEGHVYLTFPNFDELSVGEIRDGQSNKSVLFDAQGMVHHLFEDGSRVVSGYYNGMCLLSNGMMATEDGTQLLVSWLPENEKIIRFAKDEEGVLLWSIKREDGIDGTKVTFTARKMDGSICFQCDTTQPEFSELNPNDLYETLVNAGYDMNAEEISTPFIYCGGTLYRVRGWNGYVFINIANGKLHYISEFNACQIRMENGVMFQTAPSIRVLDDDFNELPEWKSIKSQRSGTPVLAEGLIYLDARRDTGEFEKYPSGFYDIHLNCIIDLSQYNIRPVTTDEPRFMNGYAALQMLNPDGVPFWGIIRKDGTWSVEPQKGTIKSIYPTKDGLLVTVSQENDYYTTINQVGQNLSDVETFVFDGANGYWNSAYEIYNESLYATINGEIVRIDKNGSAEFLC